APNPRRAPPLEPAPVFSAPPAAAAAPTTAAARAAAAPRGRPAAALIVVVVLGLLRALTAGLRVAIELTLRGRCASARPRGSSRLSAGGLLRGPLTGSRAPAPVRPQLRRTVPALAAADVVPALALVPCLPAAVGLAVDVAVASGVDVAAAALPHEAAAVLSAEAGRRAAAASLRLPLGVALGVGHALRVDPVVAALHVARAPAPINVAALARGRIGAGAGVVGLRIALCTPRPPRHATALVRTGRGVVACAARDAAVGTVRRLIAPVGAGPWVVGDAAAVRHRARVIDRVSGPVVIVGRVVPTRAPHGAAERNAHADVAGAIA